MKLVVAFALLTTTFIAPSLAHAQDPSELPPPPPMLGPGTDPIPPTRPVEPPVLKPAPPPPKPADPPVLAPAPAPEAPKRSKKKNAVALRRGNGGAAAICMGAASTVAAPLTCALVSGLGALAFLIPGGGACSIVVCPVALLAPPAVLGTGLYFAPDVEVLWADDKNTEQSEERRNKRALIAGSTAAAACVMPFVGACGGCLAADALGFSALNGAPSEQSLTAALVGAGGMLVTVGAAGTAANALLLDEPVDETTTTTPPSSKAKSAKLALLELPQRY